MRRRFGVYRIVISISCLIIFLWAVLTYINILLNSPQPDDDHPVIPPTQDQSETEEPTTQELMYNLTSLAIDFSNITNPHPYDFILNVRNICAQSQRRQPIVSVIFIHSAPGNFHIRQAVRDTWLQDTTRNGSVRYAFIMGMPLNSSIQEILTMEHEVHQDIIQESFLGTYKNLTLLSIMMLKWSTLYCSRAKTLLKVDDDTYVNVPNLEAFTEKIKNDIPSIYGHVNPKGILPSRNKKDIWYIPFEEYPNNALPEYMCGCGYAISMNVVPLLYNLSFYTPKVVLEDLYVTAFIADKISVRRVEVPQFGFYKKLRVSSCNFKNRITGHKMKTKDMRSVWNGLRRKDLKCIPVNFKKKKVNKIRQ